MSRRSAVALIVKIRTSLLANKDDRPPAEVQRQQARAADLTRLLFDVRAGRIGEFELRDPTRMHVTISSD
ncbi:MULTISPECIES: hypothetical protein [unclassified Paraburkholderia]|uniref:hypothetical protein n=1 Tax=unclassified Paraburkholderia TaxID=2615204 RepID=UPI001F11DCC0|nr:MULTISPECIES: hypothetical protein [unclassified Paraburkholderia]